MSERMSDEERARLGLLLDENAGPALPLSSAQAAAKVRAAIREASAPSALAMPRSRAWLRHALAAAAMLGLVASARAAVVYFASPEPRNTPVVSAGRAPARAPQAAEPAPAEPPMPAVSLPLPVTPAVEVRHGGERAETRARDLLAEANALRARGAYRDAALLYGRAAAAAPRSLTAHAALVAAGGLALEKLAQPARAELLYERALSDHPDGPLAPEARAGLERARRARLGQPDAGSTEASRGP